MLRWTCWVFKARGDRFASVPRIFGARGTWTCNIFMTRVKLVALCTCNFGYFSPAVYSLLRGGAPSLCTLNRKMLATRVLMVLSTRFKSDECGHVERNPTGAHPCAQIASDTPLPRERGLSRFPGHPRWIEIDQSDRSILVACISHLRTAVSPVLMGLSSRF